jgi:aspartate/methionine/tyrosine aminotransferase
MRLYPFEMERWQSTWENRVEYNLSESGVQPLRLEEILDDSDPLMQLRLGYTQSNGTDELRTLIANLYAGSSIDDVLVTNGSSEANFVVLFSFLERGTEAAIMLPNYMQAWGLAKTIGAKARPFWLKMKEGNWILDVASLRKAVNRRTKLIAICNPNNPTGAVLNENDLDEICRVAGKAGAWVLSDEVYRGTELDGRETPTLFGRYEKSIVTSGLSKAYGLPGLRIGWVTTKRRAAKLWAYRDYTTIAPGAISDFLARNVLQPEKRRRILERTRNILRSNLPIITRWVDRHRSILSFAHPRAGAIAYLKYSLNIESTELARRLLTEKKTLIVPGRHFHMGRYVRIGFGDTSEKLEAGLTRVGELLQSLEANR